MNFRKNIISVCDLTINFNIIYFLIAFYHSYLMVPNPMSIALFVLMVEMLKVTLALSLSGTTLDLVVRSKTP